MDYEEFKNQYPMKWFTYPVENNEDKYEIKILERNHDDAFDNAYSIASEVLGDEVRLGHPKVECEDGTSILYKGLYDEGVNSPYAFDPRYDYRANED